MSKRFIFSSFLVISFLSLILLQAGCSTSEQKKEMNKDEMIKHGAYLVNLGGCNDCHSPKVFTDNGPVPDTTKLLSGSPANMPLPKIDTSMVSPGKWYMCTSDLTAWIGPWGVSYAANLSPDPETGLGNWTEEIFIKAIRTGKHMGFGRQILPPMPWDSFARLTDEDLKSIFAYLKSLPPVKNKVHDPVPPPMVSSLNNM